MYKIKTAEECSEEIGRTYFTDHYNNSLLISSRISVEFPYSLSIHGGYTTHYEHERWCWGKFGPIDGECCFGEFTHWDVDDNLIPCKTIRDYRKKYSKLINRCIDEKRELKLTDFLFSRKYDPKIHHHKGRWCKVWQMKYGYDSGFQEYRFKNKQDITKFEEYIQLYCDKIWKATPFHLTNILFFEKSE